MKTLVMVIVVFFSFCSFSCVANAATQKEILAAEKAVKKGIYINDAGTKVSKPDEYICRMYRNTYSLYKDKTDWLLAVVRRGC